jgi:hypothetical protein
MDSNTGITPKIHRGEDHNNRRGITLISFEKWGNSPSLLSKDHPNTTSDLGYRI